jgi:hypothetical protein
MSLSSSKLTTIVLMLMLFSGTSITFECVRFLRDTVVLAVPLLRRSSRHRQVYITLYPEIGCLVVILHGLQADLHVLAPP